MNRTVGFLYLGATTAGATILLAVDEGAAVTLAGRLAPIFLFVIGMSIVVNISSQVGAFEALTRGLERIAPSRLTMRRHALWAGLVLLSIVVTVFLSLDTTAIMLTPLAVAVARRNGLNLVAVSLAVIWIANLASLPLPVSNLTNLLALSSGAFSTHTDYLRQALFPGIAAIAVAIVASWVLYTRPGPTLQHHRPPSEEHLIRNPLLPAALLTLAALLPALASPISYWISSTVAAVTLGSFAAIKHRGLLSLTLVPWASLLMATTLSTVATAFHVLGGSGAVRALLEQGEPSATDLMILAAAGALISNLINNLPAFLILEPAASTSTDTIALLIGVNAGPLITPWASLATLLWHDQLVRAGVIFRWRTFVTRGLLLVPFALLVPTAALLIQVS